MAVISIIRTTKSHDSDIAHRVFDGSESEDRGYHLEFYSKGEPIDKEVYAEVVKHMTAIKKIYEK